MLNAVASSSKSSSATLHSDWMMMDQEVAPPPPRPPRPELPDQAVWQHRVSAAFGAMAEQITTASQVVAMIPPMNESVLLELKAKLELIEENQTLLRQEMDQMKELIAHMNAGPEKFEKLLNEQVEAVKADRLRLPARLHNATAHKYPQLIKPPPITPGKFPKNFPNTKGEFEHLTKERYEGIMQEYGVAYSGDTANKRETLRAFLGLPAVEENNAKKR